MKIFTKPAMIAALILGGLSANAQDLGKATVLSPEMNGGYVTFIQTAIVTYQGSLITIADEDLMCLVTMGDQPYSVYAEVYYDSELALELGQTNTDPAWGNTLIIDFSEESVAAGHPAGEYLIEIPEGLVKDRSGATNADQAISIIRYDTAEPVSISPAEGLYPPSELTEVTVSFKENVSLNSGAASIQLREKDNWTGNPIYLNSSYVSVDGRNLVLDLSKTLPRGIEYMVLIPEGFVTTGEFTINKDIWMYYTQWDGLPTATIIEAPEPNSGVNVKPFVLTWDYQVITLNPNGPDTLLEWGYPSAAVPTGDRVWIPADYYELVHVNADGTYSFNPSASESNGLYLDLSNYGEDFAGLDVRVAIPAGLVYNADNLDNPPLNYFFIVKNTVPGPDIYYEGAVLMVQWTDSPWVTLGDLDKEVTLLYPDGSSRILENTWGGYLPGEVTLENEEYHGLKVELTYLYLLDGEYTMTIPAGYLWVSEDMDGAPMNDVVSYTFVMKDGVIESGAIESGVEKLKTETSISGVYDLQGRKLRSTQDLNGLDKGIYIVNGKKIIIK